MRSDPLPTAVCALGIAQITAWGTGYYCLGVLAGPIAADTGWSRSLIYFGFTVALLAMGAVSTWPGRAIDRHGARSVMALGVRCWSRPGLYALSLVRSEAAYLAVWVVLGVGMRLSLYDAAFAALVQVVPSAGGCAISYLTLFGAFASTVFWVIGHYLNEAQRLAPDAGAVRRHQPRNLPAAELDRARAARSAGRDATAATEAAPSAGEAPLEGTMRAVAMALFALVMSLNGFVFAVVTVQLVPLLEAAGLATAAAVWVASLKGFAQFGGRMVEIVFGRNLRAITVARIAIGVLPVSFALLLAASGKLYVDRRVHAADGRVAGRDHHRPRRGAARAFRRGRLRRGARPARDAGADRQCGLADDVRDDRRPLGLARVAESCWSPWRPRRSWRWN